jgi:DNA-binding NarL/FixJ family response regulator
MAMLQRIDGLDVVGCVHDAAQLREGDVGPADVGIVSTCPQDETADEVHQVAALGLAVLVLGSGWTPERVAAAFAAGATGCLLKDMRVFCLATAVNAVALGHTVVSPELWKMYTVPVAGMAPPISSVGGRDDFASRHLLSLLTDREREVLNLLAAGMSTAEAAAELKVSRATVKSHVSHAIAKLGVRNRVEAVLLAHRFPHHEDGGAAAGRPVSRLGYLKQPRGLPVPSARAIRSSAAPMTSEDVAKDRRTWPSPPAPNAAPGVTATAASRSSHSANRVELANPVPLMSGNT